MMTHCNKSHSISMPPPLSLDSPKARLFSSPASIGERKQTVKENDCNRRPRRGRAGPPRSVSRARARLQL